MLQVVEIEGLGSEVSCSNKGDIARVSKEGIKDTWEEWEKEEEDEEVNLGRWLWWWWWLLLCEIKLGLVLGLDFSNGEEFDEALAGIEEGKEDEDKGESSLEKDNWESSGSMRGKNQARSISINNNNIEVEMK